VHHIETGYEGVGEANLFQVRDKRKAVLRLGSTGIQEMHESVLPSR